MMEQNKSYRRIDTHAKKSSKGGAAGIFESFLKRFRTLGFLVMLSPIAIFYCISFGVALTPGLFLFDSVNSITSGAPALIQYFCLGIAMGAGFLLYGVGLVLFVPLMNYPFLKLLRPGRYGWYSLEVIPWYYHNALTYLVRYTFLDFITPTPLNTFFFKAMGMKIGRGSIINTSNISDPCLIEMGSHVTVGGSAHIFAHYGMKGILVIGNVKIGNRVTLGLKCSIMGDSVIGDDVTIAPHEVVLPKARIQSKKAS